VGLLRLGYKVGTIDLDSHQGTLTAYVKNRWRAMHGASAEFALPMPEHIHLDRVEGLDLAASRVEEIGRVEGALAELSGHNDFVVVDTPGSDRFMSIVGHSHADTLVTPMNDSFVDLDLLAKIDPQSLQMTAPSVYTDMVWDLRRQREKKDGRSIRWFVLRNRLNALDSRNKREVGLLLDRLQGPLGYTLLPGFAERVVYRELFLKGLTLLDLRDGDGPVLSLPHINARQEVRSLVRAILPDKAVSTLSLLKTS
jgi:chromosome partitioning protein